MDTDTLAPEPQADPGPLYARLPRRIQAVVVDTSLLVMVVLLATAVAGGIESEWASTLLVRASMVLALLYEPVLVSLAGSTVGHRALNLRVVSGSTGGRLPFFRALLRSVFKAVFGLLSFVFVLFTRRHQALHDLAADALVQVRDPARASPLDYAVERVDEAEAMEVHWARRLGVGLGYSALAYVALSLASVPFVSGECAFSNLCEPGEDLVLVVLVLLWLGFTGIFLVSGWRGRLPGARGRAGAAAPSLPEPS